MLQQTITLPTSRGKPARYLVSEFPISRDFDGRGFHYEKLGGDGSKYNVLICNAGHDKDTCDCPDATFRERRCKHMAAVRALLVAAEQARSGS